MYNVGNVYDCSFDKIEFYNNNNVTVWNKYKKTHNHDYCCLQITSLLSNWFVTKKLIPPYSIRVFTGDINLDLMTHSEFVIIQYLNILSKYRYVSTINEPKY